MPKTLAPGLLLFLAAAAPARAAPPTHHGAGPVIAAERAFAADALAMGVKRSFLRHLASDAIVFQPDPVSARADQMAQADDQGGPPLVWWPLWAGMARSGDLGFTTGPFTYDGKPGGYYFTVWKRQAGGEWKWIFDGGVGADSSAAPGRGAQPAVLATAAAGVGSAKAATAQVAAAEASLADEAARDLTGAYLKVLAEDGRLQQSRAAPAIGPTAAAVLLKLRAPVMTLSPLGGQASAAGDLVWTYGDARWNADGKPLRGHYVRIWQKRRAGWKLEFDELIAAPAGA